MAESRFKKLINRVKTAFQPGARFDLPIRRTISGLPEARDRVTGPITRAITPSSPEEAISQGLIPIKKKDGSYTYADVTGMGATNAVRSKASTFFKSQADELGQVLNRLNKQFVEKPTTTNRKAYEKALQTYKKLTDKASFNELKERGISKPKFKQFLQDARGRFKGSKSEAGFINPQAMADSMSPTINRIGRQGTSGRELADRIIKATDVGEVNTGKRLAQIRQAPRMTRKEQLNLTDVLEGRAKPMNDTVEQAFKKYDALRKDVAKEAIDSKVQVRRRTILNAEQPGLTPLQRDKLRAGKTVQATVFDDFKPRENYFPHTIPTADDLAKGTLRKDVAEGMVQRGVRKTTEEAEQFIDDWREFVRTGKQQDSLIDYMVETGQAKNTAEAYNNLMRYRRRTIKRGAVEYAREVDLPFYDPIPERAFTSYIARESKRLSQIREFGQNNERINNLIKNIRDTSGEDAAEVTRLGVDRILGIINEQTSVAQKASLFLRTLQGFKLGLAAIPNITQGVLNSMLKGDLRAVGAGLKGLLTKDGRLFALQSGATLDSVIAEISKETGALRTFLKATGFTLSEKINRTLAANAGKSYGTRLFKKARKGDKNAANLLKEFGVDTTGKQVLTDDDVLMMAKKFTDITQFRSRPQDLPLFASSNIGKVFFQFKNFIYNQTRLVARETIGELSRGNFGRGTRNLLILSTIFPLTGEAIADIRAMITGRKRESKGLTRYFENIGQVGGMGMFYDAIKSAGIGRGLEYIVGPTFGDAGDLLTATTEAVQGKPKNLGKFFTKRIPIISNRVTESAFPSAQKTPPKPGRIQRRPR